MAVLLSMEQSMMVMLARGSGISMVGLRTLWNKTFNSALVVSPDSKSESGQSVVQQMRAKRCQIYGRQLSMN